MIATQTRVWGGSAHVPFPLDESLIEDELFWALADALDLDAWVVHTGKLADLKELDPPRYAELVHELRERHADLGDVVASGPITIAMQEPLSDEVPSEELYEAIVRRTGALDFRGVSHSTSGDQHDRPPYPFTDALLFGELPEHLSSFETNVGAFEQLMLTTEYGRFAGRSAEAIPASTKQKRHELADLGEVAKVLFAEYPGWVLPWTLSEWGLDWYGRTFHRDRIPLVVGSEPMDFAFFYALRRMRSLAYWLPDELVDEPAFTRRLARALLNRATRTGASIAAVSATVDADGCQSRLERITAVGAELSGAHVAQWREVVPEFPNRLYEVDRHGESQPLVLQSGRTPEVVSPLPAAPWNGQPDGLHWITEITVADWQPVRSNELAQILVPTWGGDPTVVRVSTDGIAYRCPPSATLPSRTVAGLVVNPFLRPLDLAGQIAELLPRQGWRTALSDKGGYARESVALFGGFARLCETITDPGVAGWLSGFVGPDPYGMELTDDRRYLSHEDVASRFASDIDPPLETLEDAGALRRGLILKCKRCRGAAFYEVGEIARHFVCRRCQLEQIVDRWAWLGEPEPSWRYGLAEVLFQLFKHNGHLPLLGLYEAFKDSRRPFDLAHEVELFPPADLRLREDNREDKREIDLLASDGYRLWIGEATKNDNFGDGSKELLRLRELLQVGIALDCYGILLVTSADALRPSTETRLQTALDELDRPLPVKRITGLAEFPASPAIRET